jgi:hypothetical protein
MTGVEELNKRWEGAAARPIKREMSFEGDFLVLGAQTRLAKVDKAAADSIAQASSPESTRLLALLAAAHGSPITASSLRHIQRALEKKRDGDVTLALIHLALSKVAKLRDAKEDARRLFLADALMSEGVGPLVILKGLGFDPPSPDGALGKYNPDQPRVSAGNPDGGQWTSGGWGTDSSGSPTASSTADPNGQPFELAQIDLDQTCSAFIAANCKASILRVFPGQYLDCTLRELQAAAKEGDAAARTACKLLNRGKYRK